MQLCSMVSLAMLVVCTAAMVLDAFAGPIGLAQTERPEYPKPYGFEFKMDDGNGTQQHRQEIANENGEVKGTYGYIDPSGFFREVNYVAGENGFQVRIKSNEPGITNQNSANVIYVPNN